MATLPTRTTASFDAIKPVPDLVKLDNEFNQYVGASGIFNGGTTATKLLVKASDAADPPLEIDQTGAGPLAEWKQNGTLKVSVGNSGQVISAVTTGTAPLSIASTTVNTNLNADLLDGREGNSFVADPGGNGFVDRTALLTAAARTLTGTANQISITNGGGGGNPVFSTPQDIATSSSPTFGGLTISSGSPTISLTDTTATEADFQIVVDINSLFIKAVGVGDAITIISSTRESVFAGQVSANANLRVGSSGTVIKNILTGTTNIDPASLLSAGSTTGTFTVTGAAVGDVIIMTAPNALETGLFMPQAVVTAADTVTWRIGNYSAGTIDGASRTWVWMWVDIT